MPVAFGKAGARNVVLLALLVAGPLGIAGYIVVRNELAWTSPFRDIATIARVHPLSGAISTLGLLVWTAAATIWLCTALLSRAQGGPWKSFATAAVLTAYLAIDDSFQFHETLLPALLTVHERPLLVLIGLAGIAYAFGAREMILRTPLVYLLCLAFLPISMVLDNSGLGRRYLSGDARAILEDVAKWIGIVGWLMTALWQFRLLVAATAVSRAPPPRSPPGSRR